MGFGLTNRLIRIAAYVGNAGFVPSKERWKVSKRWYSGNGVMCIDLVIYSKEEASTTLRC